MAGLMLTLTGGIVDDDRSLRFEEVDDPDRVLVTMLDGEGDRISSVYVSKHMLSQIGRAFSE